MPENEIYKFLKENDLTDKDEASFTKEYSDPKKAKELHNFMIENDLTDKDSATFYETYFDPSKKKVQNTPTTSNGLENSSTQELGSSGKTKTVEEFNAKYGTNYTDLKTGQTKVDNAEKGVLVPFSPIKVKQPSGEKDFIAPKVQLPDLTKAPMKRYEKAYDGITGRIDNNTKEFDKVTAEAEKQGKELEGTVNKYNNELKQASTVIQNELKAKYEGLLKAGSISVEDANLKFKEEYQKGYDVAQKEITSKYKPILNNYTSLLDKRKTLGSSINGDIERAKLLSNSVGIIERNSYKQTVSEYNSLENLTISSSAFLGSAMSGSLPFFLRFTNNNLFEFAAKNNMPELSKVALEKQTDLEKSELLQKMEAYAKEQAQKGSYYSNKITEKEGTVVDNFSQGNYAQAGKVAGLRFLESIPMMGAAIGMTALTGGTASAIIPGGFMFGSQNYYGEYADRPDMSETDKLNASFVKGSLEMITELSVMPLLSPLKGLIKTGGKEAVREAVEKTLFNSMKEGYGKLVPYFGWVQEGLSEYANEVGSTITDKILDPKFQDKDWGEVIKEANVRGLEAFGPGAFGGATLTLPVAINNTINKYQNKKMAREFASELEKIEVDIQNPNLTEAQKDILIARKQEIHGKLNEIFDADKQETAGATTEQVSALDDINDQQDEVAVALQDETISDESKVAFEEKAKELAEQEKAVLEEIKANESLLMPPPENYDIVSENQSQNKQNVENEIKNKELFSDGVLFANQLGGSGVNSIPTNRREINGIEFVEFSNPTTGIVDTIMSGTSDTDYVGYYRIYENGKPTNKWSSKFENQSRNKENFKTMISGVQSMLPKGHEYTEKTSISTDGLRVWNQQLSRGYELQYDENGKLITNEVAINGDAINNELGIDVNQGNFDNIRVTNNKDFEKVKKALLPYLTKFGLTEENIRNENGTVIIDLPVLRNKTEIVNEEEPNTADNGLSNDVVEPIVKNGQRITVGNNTGELHSDEGIPYLILDDGSELEISNEALKTAKLAEDNRNYRIDKNGFFEVEGETYLNPKVTFNNEGYVTINSDGGKVVKGQLAENIAYELALQKMETMTDEEAESLLGEITTNEDIQKLITENEKRNEQIKSERAAKKATEESTDNANEQGETEEQLIEKVKRIDDDVQAANELILETLSIPENAVIKFTPKGGKEALAYTVAKNKKGELDIRLNNTKIRNPKVIEAITKLYNEGKGLREETAYNEAHNQLEDLKAQIHKENGFDYTPQYKGEKAKKQKVENKKPKKKNDKSVVQQGIDRLDVSQLTPLQRVVVALMGNLNKASYIEHGKSHSRKEGIEPKKNGKINPEAFKIEDRNIYLNYTREDAAPIDQVVMGVMSDLGIEDYDIKKIIDDAIEMIDSKSASALLRDFKGEMSKEDIERHEADQAFREEQAKRLAQEQQQEAIEEAIERENILEPLVFKLNTQEIEQVEELGITEETEELTSEQFDALEALLFGEPQPINNNENGNEKEVKQGENNDTPKQSNNEKNSGEKVKGAAETELDKQIESARERLSKARKTFQEKSKEFGGRAMGDLFGKTEKEGLFDIEIETGADTKAIKPYKEAVIAAQRELDELQDPKRREKAVEFDKKQNKLDLDKKEFTLDGKTYFYHASDSKRKGRLKPNTAPQFGTGVYFSTNKELVEEEYGNKNTTEVRLNLENPVYTNTKEWRKVEELALEKANENKKRDEDGDIIDEETDIAEINSKLISDAAKELGYDAIIDKGSVQYENEIVVLDESKIDYQEDAELIELKKQLKAAKLTSDKKVIQEKIDILLEKQPKSKQSRFVPQASEGVKQKQQSIIEKLKQAFPNIEIVQDEAQLNEVLAKSGARQMNNNGVVYGAIYNGKIYLNPTAIRLDTPIHEFGHIWLDIAKNKYAEYYQNLINTIKSTPYFEQAKLAYPDLTETQQAEEAVVQAIAEKGIEQLEAQDKKGVLRKVFDTIKAMGKAILKGLGIKNDMNFLKATWQDLVNKAAQDILSGKPITYATSEDIANMDIDAYPISIEGGLLDTRRSGVDRFVSSISGRKYSGLIPYLTEMFKVGGSHKEIRNLDSKRIGEISAFFKQIEGVAFEFKTKMKEWSKGKTDAEINKAIQAMQVALTKSVDALVMKNVPKELVPIIIRMRSDVDGLSQLILDSGFIDPNTELFASISANLGVYMNRSYAAFTNEKWNQMMFPDSKKRTPLMEKIYKDAYNYIRDQYDNFVEVDNELYILTTDRNGNITGVVDSMENPVDLSQTELLTKIQKAYNNKDKLTVDEIEKILMEFARFNKDEFKGQGGKIGKMDLSLFKKRQDIAEPLRAFLGEYTEPQAMYINTMTKMAAYIEDQKFLNEVKKLGEGKIFFTQKTGDYDVEIGSGKAYSPLNTMFTSPEIAEFLKGRNYEIITFPKFFWTVSGGIKFGYTALSIKSQERNFLSNVFLNFINGYYNPFVRDNKQYEGAYKLAAKELGHKGGNGLAILAKYNVLETSVIGEDLKNIVQHMFGPEAQMEFGDKDNNYKKFMDRFKNISKATLNKSADVYKFGDNIHKIFAFYSEVANVRFMFPEKTEDQQYAIAADRFKATNINYGMTPEIVKYLRANPFISAFPTFAAEAMRISVNIPVIAIKDIKDGIKNKNKAQQMVGINRLSSFTLGMSLSIAIPYFIAKSVGGDDDDERLIEASSPDYAKNTNKVIIGKKGVKYDVIDLSWQNPLSFYQVAYTMFKNKLEETGSYLQSFAASMLSILKPFVSAEIITNTLYSIYKNDNGTGFPIYNEQDSWWNKTKDISEYIYREVRPGIVKETENVYKGAIGAEEFGRKYELSSELKQLATGTKVYKVDGLKKLGQLSYKYADLFDKDYQLYRTELSKYTGNVSDKAKLEEQYNNANKKFKENQLEILKYINILRKKGVSDEDIFDKIQNIGGPYNRKLAQYLIAGVTQDLKEQDEDAKKAEKDLENSK